MTCHDLLYFANYRVGPVCQNVLRKSLNHELIYIKKGSGKFYINDNQFNIFPSQIIILPNNAYFRIECENNIEYFCAGFKGENLPDNLLSTADKDNYVLNMLTLMEKEFNSHKYYRKEMMNLLLNSIIIISRRFAGKLNSKKSIETDNFNFIINFLKAKSHIGVDMEQVAGMSGLSYHRFRHRFKELTGISPQQYIIKQRIDFAKNLLENTKYNTSAIALACGFRSVPQFITCFNKQLGVTPVKYRRIFICKKQSLVK